MKLAGKDAPLVIAGPPRANLLPPEVNENKKRAAVRRRLIIGVIAVCAAVVAGYGVTTFAALDSQARLTAAQDTTTVLLAQQTEYSEVRQIARDVDLITALRQVGVSTEINWAGYVNSLQASLPAGVVITNFTADSVAPIEVFTVPTAPLQGVKAATLELTLTSPSLAEISQWLNVLRTLPGYVDASMANATLSETGGYDSTVTLRLDEGAFSKRYADPDTSEPESPAESTEEGAED